MQRVTKLGRFYALLNKTPFASDLEGFKDELVRQFTGGRTTHVHEMTQIEYDLACNRLAAFVNNTEARKAARSKCLHLMQKLGVDTSDWARVNAFCRDARIAGRDFYYIDVAGLNALAKKLRAIERAGGLGARKEAAAAPVAVVAVETNAEA